MTFNIRPYHPADLTALYRVCLQTGDHGADATHLFQDPELLGHFFVAPYVVLQPELAFVLTENGRPCGYVLGTSHSTTFYTRCEREWFPPLRERYPLPAADDQSPDAQMIRLIHEGHLVEDGTEAYPAHLHIDLLPVGQGQGWGRKMMETFLGRLRDMKVTAVHLQVSKENSPAIGFYTRMGFHEVIEYTGAYVLGKTLTGKNNE